MDGRQGAILLGLLFMVLVSGCAGSSGGSKDSSRGDLSEAMTEKEEQDEGRRRGEGRTRTRTDHTEQNDTETTDTTYESDDDTMEITNSASVISWIFHAIFSGGGDEDQGDRHSVGGGQTSAAEESVSLGRFSVGYRHSWSEMAGDAVTGFESSMVTVGFGPKDGVMGYLGFYFGKARSIRADLARNATDLGEAGLEAGFRAYLTPDHTLMGSYLVGGLRIGEISWRYRDPIDGGPFLGVGVSVLQTRFLHVGASVTAGIRFTRGKTSEDFNNDIFKDVGFYQWNLEGIIRF